MKKCLLSFVLVSMVVSCQQKTEVDFLVINAKVYTVNSNFEEAEASNNIIDAKGQTIVPGFIDAHCHFLNLGFASQEVDLFGTNSFDEVVNKIIDFSKTHNTMYIRGRGWDQNDWENKEFPDNVLLNKVFPNTPVILKRIDGHASLVNQAALDLGNVTVDSKVNGGELVTKDGKLTGILIDNAQGLVLKHWPNSTRDDTVNALLKAQEICFENGLTTVDDAGLGIDAIEVIDSLQKEGSLKMRVYAMVSGTPSNVDYYLNKGLVKTENLHVRSFKFYADGALGSRGALLREPYSDKPGHFGLQVTPLDEFKSAANRIANSEFQMNTHAIGDSANHAVLHIYKEALKGKKDRRWRIEHAQIISPEDFKLFDDMIPSVQPTHATSDMYWAEDRLGKDRIKGAYANKQLLNAYGKVALGTDFPVEEVSPFLTFYAAVARQDLDGYPKEGYQTENALTREETLKGMTIWAAYSNFEEHEKGSIEVGKFADFIILDKNIMEVPVEEIPTIKVLNAFIDGQSVYNQDNLAK